MDESGHRLLFRLIWPLKPKRPKKHTYVERLQQLNEARTELLTEDEHTRMRREILSELTQHYRLPVVRHTVFAVSCIASVALLLYGLSLRRYEYVTGAVVGLVAALLMWVRMAQDAASKRALSREDRHSVVDDLLAARLISDEEATKLRIGINELFQTRNAG